MTGVLPSYHATAGSGPGRANDELLAATGAARSGWELLTEVEHLTEPAQLATRRGQLDRLLAEHGVTYGVAPEEVHLAQGRWPAPQRRNWQLDPVPLLLDESEWAHLAAGVAQRAELLDAVLTDVYGERRLLRDDLLPPEVVLAHPGFLRAVDGVRLPGPRQLFLTATDLCRDSDRRWRVIGDRTQAPSGMGYAMEDRRVIAQVMSGMYRQAPIHRIGPFFHALRQALQEIAPRDDAEPHVALLTPGPWSETAFDQAYLSSMLGFPLVEGSDLQVSGGRLWARGLDSLQPVDVLLRRVDAEFCDPLDLRTDSRLGVPGLVTAARSGSVSVVNTLGSAVLENPALLAFLPRLATAVLGTDLLLEAATTVWCGQRDGLRYVVDHLAELVLKPVARGAGATGLLGWQLSAAEREELRTRILAQPAAWVGQHAVASSTVPTLHDGALRPRPAVLRAFAVAHRGQYTVMSGGLARVAADDDSLVISNARGALAKDVWVLSSEPYQVLDPWIHDGPTERVARLGVSHRTAENLFWMGRYAERAGDTVRLLRAVADRWSDFHAMRDSVGHLALVALLPALGPGGGDALRRRLTGPEPSVAHAVARMSGAAMAVREQLSADTWVVISGIERTMARAAAAAPADPADGIVAVADRVLEGLLAIAGLGAESMTRDTGWQFMEAGRRVERAQFLTSSLSRVLLTPRPDAVDSLVLESLLITHESVITYRRRHQSRASVATVLDLLVKAPENPRSLRYQADRLADCLDAFPGEAGRRLLADIDALIEELDTGIVAGQLTPDGRRERLGEVLESVDWRLRALSDELAAAYFTHPAAVRSMDDPWGGS